MAARTARPRGGTAPRISASDTNRETKRTLAGARAPQRLDIHPRPADDPQLRSLEAPPGIEQDLDPLIGPQEPEEQNDREAVIAQLRRQRHVLGEAGQVVEGAVRDHVDLPLLDPARSSTSRRRPYSECTDDGVDGVVQPSLGAGLARARLAREQVVGGQDDWPRGEQAGVQPLQIEPLEVDDVGLAAREAAIAEHVRHVLGELGGTAQGGPGSPRRMAIEQLTDVVALGDGHLPVREPARDQLHVRPVASEGCAQRAVVGRREGRGVDNVSPHHGRWAGCTGRPASAASRWAVRRDSSSPSGWTRASGWCSEPARCGSQRRQRRAARAVPADVAQGPKRVACGQGQQGCDARRHAVVLAVVDLQFTDGRGDGDLRTAPSPSTRTASSRACELDQRIADGVEAAATSTTLASSSSWEAAAGTVLREREAGQLVDRENRVKGEEPHALNPPSIRARAVPRRVATPSRAPNDPHQRGLGLESRS